MGTLAERVIGETPLVEKHHERRRPGYCSSCGQPMGRPHRFGCFYLAWQRDASDFAELDTLLPGPVTGWDAGPGLPVVREVGEDGQWLIARGEHDRHVFAVMALARLAEQGPEVLRETIDRHRMSAELETVAMRAMGDRTLESISDERQRRMLAELLDELIRSISEAGEAPLERVAGDVEHRWMVELVAPEHVAPGEEIDTPAGVGAGEPYVLFVESGEPGAFPVTVWDLEG